MRIIVFIGLDVYAYVCECVCVHSLHMVMRYQLTQIRNIFNPNDIYSKNKQNTIREPI